MKTRNDSGRTIASVAKKTFLALVAIGMLNAGCGAQGEEDQEETDVGMTQEQLYLLGARWPGGVVNVCYDGTDGNNQALLAQARTILANTWTRAAKISFVGWGQCNYSVTVASQPTSFVAVHFQAGTRGSSNFGMLPANCSWRGCAPGVNNLYLVSDDAAPQTHFTYEVIHEFGHALGWAHEQERPDNWNGSGPGINCNSLDNGTRARNGGTYETPYFDSASVMNYCNPAGWPDVISNGDVAGARAAYRSPISYTTGDFNGDGKTDVIITNASGSYWYYSTGTGTWNPAYTRNDLTLDNVSYTPGDFNGDGKTDLIISNSSGSYWYYSTGTGTWNAAYIRYDLPRQATEYVTGDFNGDGKTDVIITNSSGSYWYYSTGTGTWNAAYIRYDLPIGQVTYVPGDFNGDGKTDLIITTASGSYWYYSTGTGSWNAAYTRNDLVLGSVAFTPGDFNGDGKADVIISNSSGSYWYYSTGTGTWNPAYTRYDLPVGAVSYYPGDFNGDGKTDLIISNWSGSYWYYSTGAGTWNPAYTRNDLPVGATQYKPGDFNGDGKADVIITNSSGSYWYYSTGTGTWNSAYIRYDLPL